MAKHNVQFDIPQRALGKADVKFVVKSDDAVLGTLMVSNGSLVWFPRKATKGLKMGWQRFDELMKNGARTIERR
jgi:hypothetical protein